MRRQMKLQYMLVPLFCMLLIAAVLLVQTYGMRVEDQTSLLPLLPITTALLEEDAGTNVRYDPEFSYLLITNSQRPQEQGLLRETQAVLNDMRITYDVLDLSQETLPPLANYRGMLFCTASYAPLSGQEAVILEWLENGGHLAQLMPPEIDSVFRVFYRKFGITELANDYANYSSLRMNTQLLPFFGSEPYVMQDTEDYLLIVRLEKDCIVHIQTADDHQLPLLWERPVQDGRIVVLNCSLAGMRDGRGLTAIVLSLLEDVLAYPIVNSGMVFIDDFPAPQPAGYDDWLLEQYGYNVQGFFRNHWWPDMEKLSLRKHVPFTGVLIETYNDHTTAPFLPEGAQELLRYYGTALLQAKGEIGLHGYNHIPLCLQGFPFSEDQYKGWPSVQAMEESLHELSGYGTDLFPEANYRTYVPPSNFLSEEGQEAVLQTLPNVRVVSGVYLPQEGGTEYVHSFHEEENGLISVPRVSSGFMIDSYLRFVIAQELTYHGVFSHFIHPDDVLDVERGALSGWDAMFSHFDAMIDELQTTYPQLRWMVSADGAAAVQRYSRLRIRRETVAGGVRLTLENFYDNAWLALRTRKEPWEVRGGKLYPVSENFYWIEVNSPEILIMLEDTP